eukprot:1964105-Prymnesium_polylepis.1
MEANFPERLKMSIVYPVPWLVKASANAFISFLPSRTRSKFHLCSKPEEICELAGIDIGQLPADLAGGVDAAREAAKAAGFEDADQIKDGE